MPQTMSLPMASDTARSEGRFILDAARRVAEQLHFVEEAARDGQARIRETQRYVERLLSDRAISADTGKEILRRLLPPNELKE